MTGASGEPLTCHTSRNRSPACVSATVKLPVAALRVDKPAANIPIIGPATQPILIAVESSENTLTLVLENTPAAIVLLTKIENLSI